MLSWANYTRTQFCFLLQITITNAVKFWHNSLKQNRMKRELQQYNLKRICMRVNIINRNWNELAARRKHDYRIKHVMKIADISFLAQFSYSAQKLIAKQLQAMIQMKDNIDDREVLVDNSLKCICLFWKRFQLSCKHILWKNRIWDYIMKK